VLNVVERLKVTPNVSLRAARVVKGDLLCMFVGSAFIFTSFSFSRALIVVSCTRFACLSRILSAPSEADTVLTKSLRMARQYVEQKRRGQKRRDEKRTGC
jgi:hypothetical protein